MISLMILVTVGLLASSILQIGCGSTGNIVEDTSGQAPKSSGPNGRDLFREALANALSVDENNLSGNFEVDGGAEKLKGEFSGTRMRGNMEINGSMDGVPVSMSMDAIFIGTGTKDKVEEFAKITSLTTSNSLYRQDLQSYFAPAINKWVKSNDDGTPDEPTTFEMDGAFAALNLIDWYAPLVSLSDSDKNIFLTSVDKNNLYEVGNNIEKTQYKGVEARKIQVSINRDALVKVDKEVSDTISKESGFRPSDSKFIDEAFGKNSKLSADVYLATDSARIIGVTVHINFDKPITDSETEAVLYEITASVLVYYKQGPAINPPDSFMTEAEMDALMSR